MFSVNFFKTLAIHHFQKMIVLIGLLRDFFMLIMYNTASGLQAKCVKLHCLYTLIKEYIDKTLRFMYALCN